MYHGGTGLVLISVWPELMTSLRNIFLIKSRWKYEQNRNIGFLWSLEWRLGLCDFWTLGFTHVFDLSLCDGNDAAAAKVAEDKYFLRK